MIDMRGVDLNLLVSLDALIEEANVTRAAARLGVSQPALSAQLARLRDLFRDPLLVPSETGRGMIATARALELRVPLHAALKDIEMVVKRPPVFDPMIAERVFSIAASDNATVVLGLALIERLRETAGPGVRVSFRNSSADLIAAQLKSGEVDLLIGSERMIAPAMKARKLIDERYVMAQRKGHPRGAKALDLVAYCSLRHVLVSTSGGSLHGFIDEQLERIGYRRNVVLSVHQFILAPMILAATDYVCTLPARLTQRFADRLDMFELPFKAQGFTLSAAWHPRNQADPPHIWLRQQLADVAAVPTHPLKRRGAAANAPLHPSPLPLRRRP
ncbi:LysR family transcriptional regulator [Methylocapsa sp. S129]|uniref:LysR family transcriptional regulator n=1 Tax=Methylocapsa sp. S129 TaxID=1641869 RepID=UPI00131CAFD1|nr:LysR family transcriptional regulator [Methylocapsa sp. S129]